ncbi:putative reverse transcriptase domain-containing protein, partial [Tanacetum coccineum]
WGRGVKEKSLKALNIEVVKDGTVPYVSVDSGNARKEVVSLSAVDETMTKERQSPLMETTGLESYPPLPTQGTTTAGTTPDKSSYANVTGTPSGTKVNFRYFVYTRGNGIDVVVPVESIRAISKRFANTAYGFFLGKRVAYPMVANYVRNTWGKYGLVRSMFSSFTELFSFQFNSMDGLNAMLKNGPWFIRNNPLILKKWHPDVNLLKEDVGVVPVWVKFHGVPVTAFSEDGLSAITTKIGTRLMLDSYTSNMCMQSWGRSSYARAMIELRADVELKDNIVATMPKITGEGYYTCVGSTKNLKKTSQISKGIPVGQKMGFKPTNQQVYQHVSKKSIANHGGNKKKNVDPANENEESSSPSTTPIIEKINTMENLIIDGKASLVDNEGKPLKKVDDDSEDEVASDDNEIASFLAKKDGYGTQCLLEQWKDSHELDDYEYDPYDDDMYEGQEIPEMLQAFCDNLDIKVMGHKKK